MKQTGAPSAGNLPAGCEVAGAGKRTYGSVSEALPEETGSKRIGRTYGAPRQSSTLQMSKGGEVDQFHE